MLTKNFYSALLGSFCYSSPYSNLIPSAKFTLVDGTSYTVNAVNTSLKSFFFALSTIKSSSKTEGVSFGSGTTAPDAGDYFLENDITDTLNVFAPDAVSYSAKEKCDEYTATYGIRNSNADAVTISEVGLTIIIYSPSGGSKSALVDRTVLDEPITIPAGESKQITYTIRFNYPTSAAPEGGNNE